MWGENSDGSYKFTAEFTIADAIKAQPPVLTEYYYYPIAVRLTEDEMEEYTKLTNWYINESRKADEKIEKIRKAAQYSNHESKDYKEREKNRINVSK